MVAKNLFDTLREMHAQDVDPLDQKDQIYSTFAETVAVLILDSTGFSRVSEDKGILHFLSRMVRMRDQVGPVIEAQGAISVKYSADNLFVVFRDPDFAVESAFAANAVIRDSGLMLTDDEPYQVCIGVGYGEMLYSETLEGYVGPEMNLASKLGEDTAEGGEILVTAYSKASGSWKSQFAERTLKMAGLEAKYYWCDTNA